MPGLAEAIDTPIRVLLAGQDRIVDSRAAAAFARRLPAAEVSWIAGARHELLQEAPAIQAQVWDAIDQALLGPR
jgi:lysophospholipase